MNLATARWAAGVLVAGALASVWIARGRARSAAEAVARAEAVTANVADIARLSRQEETALLASRPTESLSASVRKVLAGIGVGDGALRSLKASDETGTLFDFGAEKTDLAHPPAYRRQTVSLDLSPLSPKQVGQFIAGWSAAEPAWLVTRLDLTHTGGENETRYDARLTLTTTYVANTSNPAPKTKPETKPETQPNTKPTTKPTTKPKS